MTLYRGYSCLIASEIPLPELLVGEVEEDAPDVLIRLGNLDAIGPERGPLGTKKIGPFLWAGAGEFWFCVPGIAKFCISRGREIVVDLDPADNGDGVRAFLLGTALGVLLMQRGHLMLHGNAVRVDDGCVVCVGVSGAGKSTLAAGFYRRGFELLADDLVMLDDQNRVTPGVPRVKLWADAARLLSIDVAPLRRIRPKLEKYHFPVANRFAQQPLPIRAIYALASTNGETMSIEHLEGFAKFREVSTNTYRTQFVEAMALRTIYLRLCSQLAASVPVARLTRPVAGCAVDQLIDCVLEDVRTRH